MHASARQALALALKRERRLVVTGQAGSLNEARQRLTDGPFDIAVVDLDLPDGDGVGFVEEFLEANPDGSVLGLASRSERRLLALAVEAGAAGVLPKAAPVSQLVDAIRRLRSQRRLLAPWEIVDLLNLARQERTQAQAARLALEQLTAREREVLQALAGGLSDKQIAARLHISPKTVRFHMANIHAKLGVDSRLQALVFAARYRVVTIG